MSWPAVVFSLGCGVIVLGSLVLAEFRARRRVESYQVATLRTAINVVESQGQRRAEEFREGLVNAGRQMAELAHRVGKLEAKLPESPVRAGRELPKVMR